MGGEEKVYSAESDKVAKTTAEAAPPEPTVLDAWEDWQRAKRELASAPDEPEYESVELSDEQMEALSDEELDQHIDLQEKQVKLNELQKELDRRALNLGLLKLANKAPRCSHLKSNGQPGRAPTMGSNLFCVFRVRSMDNQENSRLRVELLENREGLQLTVKQIMEQKAIRGVTPRKFRGNAVENSALPRGKIGVSPGLKEALKHQQSAFNRTPSC